MLSYKIAEELFTLMKNPPTREDFHRFIKKIEDANWTDCWLWKGGRSREGYGRFGIDGSKRSSSRVITEWTYGVPATPKQEADHVVCDNPPCVNPLHLRWATPHQNWERSASPTAKYARSTHCPKGHERTPENQDPAYKRYYGEHIRACLECSRERRKLWAAKNYAEKNDKMRKAAREYQRKKLADPVNRAAQLEYQRQRRLKKKAAVVV